MKTLEEQIEEFKEQMEKEKSYQISVAERDFQTKVRNATLQEHQRNVIKSMGVQDLEFGNFLVKVGRPEDEDSKLKILKSGRISLGNLFNGEEVLSISKVSEKMEMFLSTMAEAQFRSKIGEIRFAKEDRYFQVTITKANFDEGETEKNLYVFIAELNDIEFYRLK